MNIYGSGIYYGDGHHYGGSGTDIPVDLKFYRTNVDNVYVFHWGFQEDFITPFLTTFDFELELDSDQTFTSPNLIQINSLTAIDYQNGDTRKGFSVEVPIREDKTEQIWYARVRTSNLPTLSVSAWSQSLQFNILEKFEVEEAEAIMTNLPDYHVYGKEDLLRDVQNRNSNLYLVANMYSREFDQGKLENILTSTNNYISLCRDEQLFQNFGIFFDYDISPTQEFVEYRTCLLNLILASLVGGTTDAIERSVRCFTGVTPIIQLIQDRNDFFLSTILETPPEVPNGIITDFSTSQIFREKSLVVIKNGSILENGVDYTEDITIPGFVMAVAPLGGDILQVFFDIGVNTDPDPVVFDISDTVVLTGNLTFTHGSSSVTGIGSAFTTELQKGVIIADNTGFALGEIDSITDDNNLILTDVWVGDTGTTSNAKKVNFNGTRALSGSVTFNSASQLVQGVGTVFTTELEVGDTITDNDGIDVGVVDSIQDDENLLLKNNWSGANVTTINARKLIYSEPILWKSGSLAHGVIIMVENPGQFLLDEDLIEKVVTPLIPAHVQAFWEYE